LDFIIRFSLIDSTLNQSGLFQNFASVSISRIQMLIFFVAFHFIDSDFGKKRKATILKP